MKKIPGIELVRLLALISIVACHFSPAPNPSGQHKIYLAIIGALTIIGVPVFFGLSGFLFHHADEKNFWKILKTRKYILPWLICASLLFIPFTIFFKRHLTLYSYFMFIIGNPSIYYFLFLLFIFEFFTWFAARMGCKDSWLFIGVLILGLISTLTNYWTAYHLPEGVLSLSRFYTYLNPLSFYAYYQLGRYLQKIKVKDWLLKHHFFMTFIFMVSLLIKFTETYYLISLKKFWMIYFSPASMLLGLTAIIFFMIYFVWLKSYPQKWNKLAIYGKYALPIYLLHLIFTGLFRRVFNELNIPMLPWHLLVIPAVIILTYLLIRILQKILPPRATKVILGV